MTAPDDFFAPPPFRPAEALVQLRRSLRDLRPLAERGDAFELQGKPVVELRVDADTIAAKLARRPAAVPDWDRRVLRNSADVRKCVDEVKQRLARWTAED